IGGATWLELSTQGLSKAWSQIMAPKAAQVQRDAPPRFGIYPVTRQTVRYCAVQLLPAVGGAVLVGLGAQSSGASKFLMESSGIRLLAASAGRVAQNLFTNLALLPSLMADEDNDQPHSTKSKRLIALNEGLQQIATFAAPATYAVALTTNTLPVEIATGFLNGMLDAEGQRKLEEDGLRPPNRLSVEQKKVINRVSIAVSLVFGGLMAYYLISTAYKTDKNPAVDHPATWGATGGILGTTALTFGFTKLIQHAWKSADTRGALVWLSRWFGAENTRWLAYLNGDFVHVRNMRGVTVNLGVVLTGLILTGATIGFDLALLNDDRLVCLKLSAFAWVMLMRYAVTVPGTFPMHTANATLSAVAGRYGEL
ncbi:MAG: hypothetical protein LLG04_08035, partial [Parachlamydia sp.]|nr:hypothetical protein [Parachlamydia sp.]